MPKAFVVVQRTLGECDHDRHQCETLLAILTLRLVGLFLHTVMTKLQE